MRYYISDLHFYHANMNKQMDQRGFGSFSKYDTQDSFVNHKLAKSHSSAGPSSDWWIWFILAIVMGVCPLLGVLIIIVIYIMGW